MKFTVIFIFYMSYAFGYTPTVEGLFRNSSNKEISSNTVVFKYMIKKTVSTVSSQSNQSLGTNATSMQRPLSQPQPLYLKLIFSLEEEGKINMIQVLYSKSTMAEEDLLDVAMISDLEQHLVSNPGQNIRKGLLYSLILSMGLNNSSSIINFLKNLNIGIHKNDELVFAQKAELLNKYKNYLQTVKDDPDIKAALVSPLSPESLEDRHNIQEILKQSHYRNMGYIKLQKENSEFYWNIKMENFEARFSNEKHQLREMKLVHSDQIFELKFSHYILYDGIHELPKFMIFKGLSDVLLIQALSVSHLNLKRNYLNNRYQSYKKKMEKVSTESSQSKSFIKPSFLI